MNALLHRTGIAAARHPWRVIAAWIVAAIVAAVLAGASGGALHDDYTMPAPTRSTRPTCCASASRPRPERPRASSCTAT